MWAVGLAVYMLTFTLLWAWVWQSPLGSELPVDVVNWVGGAIVFTAFIVAAAGSTPSLGKKVAAILIVIGTLFAYLPILILQYIYLPDSVWIVFLVISPASLFAAWGLAWPIRGAGWAAIAFPVVGGIISVLPFIDAIGGVWEILLLAGVACALWWSRVSERLSSVREGQDEKMRMAHMHTI